MSPFLISSLIFWPGVHLDSLSLMQLMGETLQRLTTAGGGGVPPLLDPDFNVGNNENLRKRNIDLGFLVHKFLGSRPFPPPFL